MLSPARDGSAIGVGTRFKETRTVMGRQATETMEVTEFDPPRAYTLEAVSCGVRFICRVTVLDETPGRGGGGSRLSYDITTRPTTAWARVVGPVMGLLMKKAMRTSMEKDLADIKRYVEAGGGAPAGADEAGQARHGAPVG
ncbi:MAG: hypothetical protein KatS3mg103_0943 [Phycisphaerales bacterium]|nr:MAG: hypothetical protein KatS3mg103_0943 [Phycisphaerales bacterium]